MDVINEPEGPHVSSGVVLDNEVEVDNRRYCVRVLPCSLSMLVRSW